MRAFTLLEVLVVIAIVALLGAIFLPGLSGAIQASKSTKCKSQLREIYLDCLDWLETSRRLPTASEGGWVAVTPGVMRCPADRVGYLSYQPPLYQNLLPFTTNPRVPMPNIIVAGVLTMDTNDRHPGRTQNRVFADGHVDAVALIWIDDGDIDP